MFGGWRARLHYWSRHTELLKKAALRIVIAGFGSAWLFVLLTPQHAETLGVDPVGQEIRNQWQRLHRAGPARPRDLARWLRQLMPRLHHLCDVAGIDYATQESFAQDGRLVGLDVRPLFSRHAPDAETAAIFEDFVTASLTTSPAHASDDRLKERAERATPPPLANELHAALLLTAGRDEAALTALVREGSLFADAKGAREEAVRLALKRKDVETIRQLAAAPGWLAELPGWLQYEVGWMLHDAWLIGKGVLHHRLANLPFLMVLQALFAAGLWYAILVLQSGPRRWRWSFPILPLLAGMASVWPTLWLGAWQEMKLGMTEAASFPEDLWYWIMGVGLREEVAKLALFAVFLPWLLRRREPGLALMTGAFVGLGFALEENIDYYQRYGGGVALVRFLSANFLHAAMTGVAAHALYDMLRSRFGRADRFIAVFLGVVAVHGLYDFSASSQVEGMPYLKMILLVFTAWHFLDLVAQESPGARQLVAPAAVFLIGLALLMASSFWLSVLAMPSHTALYAAAAECLMVAPIIFVYWRRLN